VETLSGERLRGKDAGLVESKDRGFIMLLAAIPIGNIYTLGHN